MIFEWDHLHLRSPDPAAAAAVYADLFGAVVSDRGGLAPGMRMTVDLGRLTLVIERVPPDTTAAPHPPFVGIEHIALRVDDIEQTAAWLRDRGVRFLKEPYSPRPGIRIAFVEGPDRVRVEIVERAPG